MIVDVDPDEAKLLIGLIEFLFHQWYVVPDDRDQQLRKIVAAAAAKQAARPEHVLHKTIHGERTVDRRPNSRRVRGDAPR